MEALDLNGLGITHIQLLYLIDKGCDRSPAFGLLNL